MILELHTFGVCLIRSASIKVPAEVRYRKKKWADIYGKKARIELIMEKGDDEQRKREVD